MNNLLDKVAVLMGGKSAEREISLISGNGVLQALLSKGINAIAFDPGQQDIFELKTHGFSSAFIALHGKYGEDGIIQGILEHMSIPYTGSGVMASAIAINKEITKRIWQNYGLLTPKFIMLNDNSDLHEVAQQLGLPLIIKPAREGSSIGINKVTHIDQIQQAYNDTKKHDNIIIAEQFITGREITCAALELNGQVQALPLIEIKAPNANYDYQNKYFTDDVQYICPADISPQVSKSIQDLTLKSFKILNCRGWARADLILSGHTPYLLEINTVPGMTSHSLVPMAAKAIGLSYEELVYQILLQAKLDYGDIST